MEIEVRVDNETVFSGQAEDFLFMNDSDAELENVLDRLELMEVNSIVKFGDMEIERMSYIFWN